VGLAAKIKKRGLKGSKKIKIVWNRLILRPYNYLRYKNAPIYQNPTSDELADIEEDLKSFGIKVKQALLSNAELEEFKNNFRFPDDYHGGKDGGVWDEKIFEHFIAYKFCKLDKFNRGDVYVDIACSGSPWAKILREKGYEAYAIDLKENKQFEGLEYYIQADAKKTNFHDSAVTACSLQCAYEMFIGYDDQLFLNECNRILRVGGKAVIAPLYMHTHHCGYSSPEYFRKGYADAGAKEYLRKDCSGIPFSRKYSASLLQERILNHIERLGMKYELLRVDNKEKFGQGIYCHFILAVTNNKK
jgi:ubiquinone/menaquinone biosynthesis C-methylase UbiE